MDWVNGFIVPIVKVIFIIGFVGIIAFFVFKGFLNAWKKSLKFTIKYKIFRKKYPEQIMMWVLDCIDKGIGWYDAKKFLFIKMVDEDKINETMWIYDRVISELNKQKGGIKYGREFKGSDSQIKGTTELPTI